MNELPSRQAEPVDSILERAAARAQAQGLPYAGAVTPAEAQALAAQGAARIVDVRTPEEYRHVGHVPETPLVEWPRSGERQDVQRFVDEVGGRFPPDEPLLLLCRSGVRSHYAAHVLSQVGYSRVYNILEGFEGPAPGQGWVGAGLPWKKGD